jgi:hypothetical protein
VPRGHDANFGGPVGGIAFSYSNEFIWVEGHVLTINVVVDDDVAVAGFCRRRQHCDDYYSVSEGRNIFIIII